MISKDSYEKLIAMLKQQEGYRQHPYRCTAGKLTIGYGRNLDDVGVSKGEADNLLRWDVTNVMGVIPYDRLNFGDCNDDVRCCVLINMAFNLGAGKILGFSRMLAAFRAGDYSAAADEMLDSKWAEQVGKEPGQRAYVLAQMMRTGEWP